MFPLAASLVALWTVLRLAEATSCEEARLKCAYRTGCGMALQNYVMGCATVLQHSPSAHCPESCQHALIALTSAEEGKDLMTCDCTDAFCQETKERVEVCRPQVEQATQNETIVSCRVAQWICKADALCSTALDYYHRFCRSMFQGRKCTHRCNNSISILRRQEKAAKLIACRCDGQEDYNCPQIRVNMARLCFPQPDWGRESESETEPPPVTQGGRAASPHAAVLVPVILLIAWRTVLQIT